MTPTPLFSTILAMNKLKQRKRKGWVLRGVKNPESVAEHSWRSSTMALLLAPPGYDQDKLARMCLTHDVCEIFGEDYTPLDGISMEEKEKREKKSLDKFLKLMPRKQAEEWRKLIQEFEEGKTKEAKLGKDIEVLEMVYQAYEYEKAKNFKKDLTEFLFTSQKRMKTKIGKKLFNELKREWPKNAKEKFDAKKYKYYY